MRSIDLALLRSLSTVAETGGFTSAEGRLHRTQSTISQQVKRLESHLGARLLLRSKNGVVPTEAGERVLGYARRLLALEAEMAGQFGAARYRKPLRIGFTDDFAQRHLPRLLKNVRTALPDIELRVTCDLSVHLRKGLTRGDFDLVFYKRTTSQGTGKVIEREPIRWIVSRGYRADPARPHPLVLFPKGCVYRQRALAVLETLDRPWTIVFESPSTASVQAAAQAGLGIALLTPSSTPRGCVAAKGLPTLGSAELVYEFGPDAPDETREVLNRLLDLV